MKGVKMIKTMYVITVVMLFSLSLIGNAVLMIDNGRAHQLWKDSNNTLEETINSLKDCNDDALESVISDQLHKIQDSAIHMIESISCPEGTGPKVTVGCDEGGTWVLTNDAPDVVINLNADETQDFSLYNFNLRLEY